MNSKIGIYLSLIAASGLLSLTSTIALCSSPLRTCNHLLLPLGGSLAAELNFSATTPTLGVRPNYLHGHEYRDLLAKPEARNGAEKKLVATLQTLAKRLSKKPLSALQKSELFELAGKYFAARGIPNDVIMNERNGLAHELHLHEKTRAAPSSALGKLINLLQTTRPDALKKSPEFSAPIFFTKKSLVEKILYFDGNTARIELPLQAKTIATDRIDVWIVHELFHWMQDYKRDRGLTDAWQDDGIRLNHDPTLKREELSFLPPQTRAVQKAGDIAFSYLQQGTFTLPEESEAFQLEGSIYGQVALEALRAIGDPANSKSTNELKTKARSMFAKSQEEFAISTLLAVTLRDEIEIMLGNIQYLELKIGSYAIEASIPASGTINLRWIKGQKPKQPEFWVVERLQNLRDRLQQIVVQNRAIYAELSQKYQALEQ